LKRQTAERWDELIDALEAWLTALRPGVLDRVQVITSSAGAARLAGQALASRIGILAGVDLLPADRWVTQLEAELGDASTAYRWLQDQPYATVRFDVISIVATQKDTTLTWHKGVDDGAC